VVKGLFLPVRMRWFNFAVTAKLCLKTGTLSPYG